MALVFTQFIPYSAKDSLNIISSTALLYNLLLDDIILEDKLKPFAWNIVKYEI